MKKTLSLTAVMLLIGVGAFAQGRIACIQRYIREGLDNYAVAERCNIPVGRVQYRREALQRDGAL